MLVYITIKTCINILCIKFDLNIVRDIYIRKIPMDDIVHMWGFFIFYVRRNEYIIISFKYKKLNLSAKERRYMNKFGPNPNSIYPNENIKSICYIKNVIKNPNIQVGDYTYYDDVNGAEKFEEHVTHHYEFIDDKLIIGKFCAIAKGIEFVMNGANHRMNSVTTYPFNIMGNGWEKATPALEDLPFKGDTVVGNDVWIGQNVTVMPGVHIGDGSIIAAKSVVAKDIPPYHIAGGNPCKIIKKRFDDELIHYLLKLKWWDWSEEKIFKNLEVLCSPDLDKIKSIK